MTSIFKSNKFFRIIKHFVLTIPLMFILGTSIYTIVNSNAKDSFSGQEEYSLTDITNVSQLEINNTYFFSSYDYVELGSGFNSNYIGVRHCELLSTSSTSFDVNIFNNMSYFTFVVSSGSKTFSMYDNSYTLLYQQSFNYNSLSFSFVLTSFNSSSISSNLSSFKIIDNLNYTYLNEAFEYGMYKFNQVGFNKFDFVGLFDGIFTDNIHNVYTDFINSYINYYLMIECVYFVPWVIHMFIHFAYDLGDYFTSSFKRNRKEDD